MSTPGFKGDRTRVIRDPREVASTTLAFLSNAMVRMDICAAIGRASQEGIEGLTEAYFAIGKRGGRLRFLTEITEDNLVQCKDLAKAVELRHTNGIRGNFGVSESEYMASPTTEEFNPLSSAIYSNEKSFVRHHQALFEMLWSIAVPADLRIKQLEEGEKIGETRLSFNTGDILLAANRFVDEMRNEALIIVPREDSIRDNLGFFKKVASKARDGRAVIRILGQFSTEESPLLREFQMEGIQLRNLASEHLLNLGLGIYDRRRMVLAQYIYPAQQAGSRGQTYLSALISTNEQIIAGIANIFESLWDESRLREREERSRKATELMQDILAHDIRNYNQIVRLNAELLEKEIEDRRMKEFVGSIKGAVDGSTKLIERTVELGRILSQGNVALSTISLAESVRRSLDLVRKAHPEKEVELSSGLPDARVRADGLLDEVFVNLFSNAVKYTEGRKVSLTVQCEEVDGDRDLTEGRYWKASVTDSGGGIPDELKSGVFTRYSKKAMGGGLGLSIVRALVVDRYSGRLVLRDKIDGDHTRGLKVEVWLPKAP